MSHLRVSGLCAPLPLPLLRPSARLPLPASPCPALRRCPGAAVTLGGRAQETREGRGGPGAAAMAAARPERPCLWQEAAALAGAVRGALGPRGGRALLLRPTGEAMPTRDGRRLLEALSVEPPAARYRGGGPGRGRRGRLPNAGRVPAG